MKMIKVVEAIRAGRTVRMDGVVVGPDQHMSLMGWMQAVTAGKVTIDPLPPTVEQLTSALHVAALSLSLTTEYSNLTATGCYNLLLNSTSLSVLKESESTL